MFILNLILVNEFFFNMPRTRSGTSNVIIQLVEKNSTNYIVRLNASRLDSAQKNSLLVSLINSFKGKLDFDVLLFLKSILSHSTVYIHQLLVLSFYFIFFILML